MATDRLAAQNKLIKQYKEREEKYEEGLRNVALEWKQENLNVKMDLSE